MAPRPTTHPASGAPSAEWATDQASVALEFPRRAARVELVGPMQGMSYAERKWLICLDGSQYVQATELLYHLLLYADGNTPVDTIATRVSAETSRETTSDEIRWLILNKLAGSGLIEWPQGQSKGADGETETRGVAPIASAPILSIKHRLPLLPYWLTAPAAAVLQHLFWAPLVPLVALGAFAVNIWLYSGADFGKSVVYLLYQPELVLFLVAADTATRIWHELGHASALRRAGAKHGDIGFALYVIFPVYYTDVSHAYRLTRTQRIRVDLGGIYFDLITMLVLFVLYRFTEYVPLLLLITLIGFGILRQFTPFMRFDGYYLIADLMGVPEPMSLLIPFIRQYVPGLRPAPGKALPKLKPIALVVLGGYLALIAAFLSRPVLLLGVAGGQILEQLPLSGLVVLRQFFFAWRNHDVMTQLAASLELAFWLFIPLGLGLFVWSLLRIFARLLLLIAHLVARRLRAQARAQTAAAGVVADRQPASAPAGPVAVPLAADRQPASAPARPVAVPLAPRPTTLRPLPTPLDGLGRPVAQPNNAALDEVRRRIEEVPLPAARELAEDVARTYERRLEQMSAELERAIAWANAVTEERNRLAVGVDEMQAALSTLAIDLRRMGKEMFTVADSASSAAASAQPGTEWTSQSQG